MKQETHHRSAEPHTAGNVPVRKTAGRNRWRPDVWQEEGDRHVFFSSFFFEPGWNGETGTQYQPRRHTHRAVPATRRQSGQEKSTARKNTVVWVETVGLNTNAQNSKSRWRRRGETGPIQKRTTKKTADASKTILKSDACPGDSEKRMIKKCAQLHGTSSMTSLECSTAGCFSMLCDWAKWAKMCTCTQSMQLLYARQLLVVRSPWLTIFNLQYCSPPSRNAQSARTPLFNVGTNYATATTRWNRCTFRPLFQLTTGASSYSFCLLGSARQSAAEDVGEHTKGQPSRPRPRVKTSYVVYK